MPSLISIVIPVYNAAGFVTDCLDSVLGQSYEPFEVILVNDASTDSTASVIASYLRSHLRGDRVRVATNSQNMGPGGCRNVGIEMARGEYIYFADSDDTIIPECIALLAKPMREHPFDFVVGGIETIHPATSKSQLFVQQPMAVYHQTEIDYDHLFKSYFRMVVWNKLYRKSFLTENKLRFEPSIFHEDQLFLFYMAFCTQSYAVIPFVTYRYFSREDSITGQYSHKNYDDLVFVMQEMSDFLNSTLKEASQRTAARKHIFMLQCNLSMHVLDSLSIPRSEQAGYVKKFGRIALPFREYLAIPKGYWRDRITFPLFYLSPKAFIFFYRIIQRLTKQRI